MRVTYSRTHARLTQMIEANKPKAIDLFCGCGGISAGLRSAGFRILAGVDIEPKYMATFMHNFSDANSLKIDLSTYNPHDLMRTIGIERGELDVLAGGPPCQGFSKNVPRKFRYLEDENNLLIKKFLDHCEILDPRLIIMENVAEMRNGFSQQFTQEIISRLYDVGYSVRVSTLNTAEYGIPQRRRRAFFIAARGGKSLEFPSPSHYQTGYNIGQRGMFRRKSFVTVWEAIGDLPSIQHGEGFEPCEYVCEPFSEFQRRVRNPSRRKVMNHIARPLSQRQYERLAALQPGQGHRDLPDELKVRATYSGAYGRLTKDMTAPTITRWVFHPGSGRWGHPVDTRTLTIREAARIQGFSDDYEFIGSFVQQAGQLGNAVPPLLVEQIALSLRKQLDI